MDDAGPIKFAISTPKVDLQANIDHALSLGLPEADCAEKRLGLFANGPSARLADLRPGYDTIAINGALQLFTDQGLAPTYWIACDPQPLVAAFLTDPPKATIYLVASKCHPGVFAALRDRAVRLWHVNDIPIASKRQVPCAVSVTICAMLLANRLGYRRIDAWGWDCCFQGDEHHAASGTLGETPQRIEIEVGDAPDVRYFTSNPTWACEVNDAVGVLPVLKWCGTEVVIHGPSMVGAILHEYAA